MEKSSSLIGVGDKREEREEDPRLCFGLGSPLPPHKLNRTGSFFFRGVADQSPGMMRVCPLFTAAQWQELQRQALIYKHFIASVPLPSHLLFPSIAGANNRGGGGFNLRQPDPEPGRCRRTDGKKWRCARDAAPDQKYCERHVHRTRPRSRKPVEPRNTAAAAKLRSTAADAALLKSSASAPNFELNLPFNSMEPRYQDLMKNNYSEEFGIGLKSCSTPALHHYVQLPNLNYTNAPNENCYPFLNSSFSTLGHNSSADYVEPTRRSTGAWSSENMSLTLSMSNGNHEETEHVLESQPFNLGGPLGEVLQSTSRSNISSPHHSAGSDTKNCIDLINLMSKSCPMSHEVSPRESPSSSRIVSSPSGVLQRALVSLSDSSSSNCSSPTFAAAAPAASEFAFHWMKQNK